MKFLSGATALLLGFLAPTASAYNFYSSGGAGGTPWRHDTSSPIPYFINLGAWDSDPNRDQIIQGIRNAFAEVENHPHVGIEFDYRGTTSQLPGYDTTNVVYLDSDGTYVPGAGVAFNFNVSPGGTINSADIALNGNTHASSPLFNLYALTLHELLHFLGLRHASTGPDSAVFENTVNLNLSPDDIAGLAVLYPNPANPLSDISGAISGTITGPDGLPLQARIVAYDQSQPQPRIVTAETATDGSFSLSGLPPGDYRFVAETRDTPFLHQYLEDGTAVSILAGDDLGGMNLQITSFGMERLFSSASLKEAVWHESSGSIYATRGYYGPVYRIDPLNGTILSVLNHPADDLAFNADGTRLCLVDQIGKTLRVVDSDPGSPTYHQVLETITGLPSQPITVDVSLAGIAYVSTNGGRSVAAVDISAGTVVDTIETGRYNHRASISPDGRKLFVGGFYGGPFYLIEIDIDPSSPTYHTVLRESLASGQAWHVAQSNLPGGNLIFQGTSTGLQVLNRQDFSPVAGVTSGRQNLKFAQTSGGTHVAFLALDNEELKNNELWILDTESMTVSQRIPLGGDYYFVSAGSNDSQFLVSGNSGLAVVQIGSTGPEDGPPVLTNLGNISGGAVELLTDTAVCLQVTASNAPTSYGALDLPSGLSIDEATGSISGTPTTPGDSAVTLSATNAEGSGTLSVTFRVLERQPGLPPVGGLPADAEDLEGALDVIGGMAPCTQWSRSTVNGSPLSNFFYRLTGAGEDNDVLRNNVTTHNSETAVRTYVMGPAQVTFSWWVNIENNQDFFSFYVNQTPVPPPFAGAAGHHPTNYLTGVTAPTDFTVTLGPGLNRLEWVYSKNQSDFGGQNRCFLDDLRITGYPEWAEDEGLTPFEAGLNIDKDGDGNDLLTEYALDLNPTRRERVAPLLSFEPDGRAVLQVDRNPEAFGVTVDIEKSSSLDPDSWTGTMEVIQNSSSRLRKRELTPQTDGYYRIRVTSP